MRDALRRRQPRQQRARRGLHRPGDRADQQADRQIRALARRSKQRASRQRRRHCHKDDPVAIDHQNRRTGNHHDQQAAEDHALGAVAIVELAADEGADRARDGQQDAERADLNRAPAEGAGRIDAAEREQRDEAIGTDHVGEEKQREIALARQLPHRAHQRAEPAAQRLDDAALPRPVRREGE